MITGAHMILFGPRAEETRVFFAEVLGLPFIDAGHDWLVFALPPAELAAHPAEGEPRQELYLMCDDLEATMAELRSKGVTFTKPVSEHPWGRLTAFRVPGGGELHIYQPAHPSPQRG